MAKYYVSSGSLTEIRNNQILCCTKYYEAKKIFKGTDYSSSDIHGCIKFLNSQLGHDFGWVNLARKVTKHCNRLDEIEYDNIYLNQNGIEGILNLYEVGGIQKINEVLDTKFLGCNFDNEIN